MGFFTPWFLAGAVAVGLPVWLHLLKKHKTTPLPFSSLMFFERRIQSSIKHRRLRYLVLFALRTALILAIVLAFAHPYMRQTVAPASRTGEVTVLAIDNSLSMRAGGRLDQARQMARRMVAGLRPAQRAQVLAFGARVQVMSEVTDDHAPLNAAIDAIEASDARTSFAELARSLRSIAQSLQLPLAVHLYSDMQQSGMPANFNDLRLNAAVRLAPHPLATKTTPNFAVENVVAPRRVYDSRKSRVLATIAGFGNSKATRSVSLALNHRVIETKTVEVPENGRATVEFLSLEVPYGNNRGEVRIDSADALAADDVFYFSVERADPRHALFIHERHAGPDRQPLARQIRLRGAFRRGRRPGRFREPVARLRPRRRRAAGLPGPHVGGSRARAGDRRSHRRNALRRQGRRAFPDGRLAGPLPPIHFEGRPLGRRQVLPGHPRGPRRRARGGPALRPDAAAHGPPGGRGPYSGVRLHLR
jgi:hypothetical protein